MKIMKKIIIYTALAASMLLFGRCDSLDLDSESSITDSRYWKSAEQFDAFIYGVHSRFRDHSWNFYLLGEARADIFGDTPFGGEATQGMERFPNNTLNSENAGIGNYGDFYANINQINLFIYHALKTDLLDEDTKNYYLGQMYGMRAYYYFQLYRSWGAVILTDETVPSLDFGSNDMAKAVSPATEVWKQITGDIEQSLKYFGDNYIIKEDRSLWSKPATLMLKAEVYLWSAHREGGVSDAMTAKNALLDIQTKTSNLGLVKDGWNRIFAYNNKGNQEIIMACHCELNEASLLSGGYGGNMLPQESYLQNYYEADGTPINTKVENMFGLIRLAPRKDLYASLDDKDSRKNFSLKAVYSKDQTTQTTELRACYPYKYQGIINGATRAMVDDYPIYRYADLLLMLAEAKYLLNEDPKVEINAVRERAYQGNYDEATIGFPNKAGDDNIAEAILQERLLEFMFEGKRWYDLRRFGDSYVFNHTTAESSQPKRLLWPIDQTTLTNNRDLHQTDGY